MAQTTSLLTALLWLIGTTWQALLSLRDLRRTERDAVAAHNSVEDLLHEVKWWRHPAEYRRHRREVRDLLRESPDELHAWERVRRQIVAWSVLVVASLGGFISTLFSGPAG